MPFDIRLFDSLERNGDRSRRALTHSAMTKIGVVIADRGRVSNPTARAAAAHLLVHRAAPFNGAHVQG